METPARLAALAVVALLLGGATVLVLRGVEPGDGDSGTYPVRVTGPDGDLWNGTVALENATAHAALLAAAEAGGFDVEVRRQRGYEPCDLYVQRVGPHGEGGAGGAGWVYEVRRDGDWQRPVVGACAFPLHEGDEVWWRYAA